MQIYDPDVTDGVQPQPSGSVTIPDATQQQTQFIPQQTLSIVDPDAMLPKETNVAKQFAIGAGRGLQNRAEGAKQMGLELEHFLSGNLGITDSPTREAIKEYVAKVQQERDLYDATPVAQTKAAKAGELVGEMAADAPLALATGGESATARAATSVGAGGLMGLTTYVPPGQEDQRAINTVLGGALGGVSSLGFDTARINANLIKSKLRASLKEPDILRSFNEAEQLSKETGIDFTLGQSTGSRSLLSFEQAAAQSERSADRVLSLLNGQYRQALNRINKTINLFSRQDVSPDVVGDQLKRGMNDVIEKKLAVRSADWDKNMQKAVQLAGDEANFVPTVTASKLDDVIAELSDPSTDYPASALKKAQELRDFSTTPWTIDQVQNRLKFWGRAANGKGQVFADLDTADKRRFANDLKSALEQDLDNYIKENPKGESAYYLRQARESWKRNSAELDDLKNTVVGQLVNKGGRPASPEAFYKKIQSADPSEIRSISSIMDNADPSIMNNVRAMTLRDALDAAKLGPEAPESLVDLNPAQFIKNLPEGPKFDAIFGEGVNKTELVKTMRAIKKISDRGNVAGTGQSPLGTAAEVSGLAGGAIGGGGLPDPVFVGRFLAKNISPQRYAELMMTKEGRNAVNNISKWNMVPRKVLISSIGTLIGVLSENTTEPVPEAER